MKYGVSLFKESHYLKLLSAKGRKLTAFSFNHVNVISKFKFFISASMSIHTLLGICFK